MNNTHKVVALFIALVVLLPLGVMGYRADRIAREYSPQGNVLFLTRYMIERRLTLLAIGYRGEAYYLWYCGWKPRGYDRWVCEGHVTMSGQSASEEMWEVLDGTQYLDSGAPFKERTWPLDGVVDHAERFAKPPHSFERRVKGRHRGAEYEEEHQSHYAAGLARLRYAVEHPETWVARKVDSDSLVISVRAAH